MKPLLTSIFSILLSASPLCADTLWNTFLAPPPEARTKVWWFHGETTTTREGIDADLQAFKDAGVGGVVFYDQVHGACEGAVPSMSPEWWAMLKYAARRADELGLSFEVAASNGYVAGGPWITPELGMKKTAYIQTLAATDPDGILRADLSDTPKGFCDVATVIFPDSYTLSPLPVTSDTVTLTGGKEHIWTFDLPDGFEARGITYSVNPRGKGSTSSMNIPGSPRERYFAAMFVENPPLGTLEFSDDGLSWTPAASLPAIDGAIGHKSKMRSVSFPAASGRKGRIHIHDWMAPSGENGKITLSDFVLHPRDIVDNLEEKTGLRTEVTYPSPVGGSFAAVDTAAVIDVSSSLSPDGRLAVHAPQGTWRVIRFGYVPTGAKTKHGRKNLIGLEADVMSADAARCQFDNYFRVIADTLRAADLPVAGMCMDSHEAGIQNWTSGFDSTFTALRGYGFTPWIPAMAGYIVSSRPDTDRFLSDFRRSVAETIASQFYATLDSLCTSCGVTFTSQAMLNIDNDNIMSRGRVSKPQGEFWAYQTDGNYDVLDAASSAHIYGHPIASAEAFTDTPYSSTWDELLRIANLAYCQGINEFVVCASSYQPWLARKYDDSASAHPYVFHRFHPRWDSVGPFWDYQARCSAMLRQGDPVVDLCVYLGEALPAKTMAYRLPAIPGEYTFDVSSPDALLHRFQAGPDSTLRGGSIPYKALLIEDRAVIGPEAAAKISELQSAGVPVIRCSLGSDVRAALRDNGITPSLTGIDGLRYCRRHLPDGRDIYFLYNHSDCEVTAHPETETPVIEAEVWNPADMSRRKLTSSLTLQPWQALFLITRPSNYSDNE